MTKNKLVYFIILNWKNFNDTLECLNSINRINYSNYKIVLINNDLEDILANTVEKFEKLIIINNKQNFGFAKGCNQGIKKAIRDRAEYILLINNDTVVDKNFLRPLLSRCFKQQKTIVSPGIYLYDTNRVNYFGGKLIYWLGTCRLIKTKKPTPPDYLSGACLLAKTKYFIDIGYFDENYFAYFEDVDWSLRARRKGYKLTIVHSSIIWHKSSSSTKAGKGWGPFKFYLLARNNFYFAHKNLRGSKKFLWIMSYLLLISNVHLLLHCRNPKSLFNHYKGIIHGFMKVFYNKHQ